MATTQAQRDSVSKYHKKFDDIKVRVPKGERSYYIEQAKDRGLTLNKFIVKSLDYIIAHNIRLKK